MKKLACAWLLCTASAAAAQEIDFTIDSLQGNSHIISAVELDPPGHTVAIGTMGGPVIFWDVAQKKVIRTVEVPGYKAGMRLAWSNDGKYLLLQQLFFVIWNPNRDKKGAVEVMDAASGKIVFSRTDVNSGCFTPNGRSVAVVEGNRVVFYDIASGTEERSLKADRAGYAVAVSNDENFIAVSHSPSEEELEKIPSVRNDKKTMKSALKYRELVSVYDFETLEKRATSSDILDIVLEMKFNRNSEWLYAYNIPHTRVQAPRSGGRQGYINKIEPAGATVTREIFSTNAYGADFKENQAGTLLGVTSLETKFVAVPQVILADVTTARPVKSFNVRTRLFETWVSDRTGFAFLPDGKTVVLGYGPYLAVWIMEE